MKRSRYTDEQIAFALKQAEVGVSVDEVCRKMGVSDAAFCTWRRKFGGLGPSEVRRLRQLEEENRKLRQLVVGLSLDRAMLPDVLSKKSVTPSRKREWIEDLCRRHGASERQACAALKLSRSVYYYRSVARDASVLTQRIKEITAVRVHYGYRRVHVMLRREG